MRLSLARLALWIGLCLSLCTCTKTVDPGAPSVIADGDTESEADGDRDDEGEAELSGVQARFALPPSTSGRYVVDAKGQRLRLAGFNWNGAEGPDFVPTGLDRQPRAAIARRIAELGFNSVRLVWSNELVETNPPIAAERLAANPDLIGRHALEVLDAVVEALSAAGVLVILNNHISDARWCCQTTDGNNLWYNERFSEESWLADWRLMARRYKTEAAVIGADLRNEPRGAATWGAALGAKYDWAQAAERGGAAVLENAPDWLIIVEGTQFSATLAQAGERPIVLPVARRLVYEAHCYPWFGKSTDTAETLQARWREQWGFLLTGENAAPLWLGEMGLCNTCLKNGQIEQVWFDAIRATIVDYDLDWSYWMLHGDGSWGVFNLADNSAYSPELLLTLQALIPSHQGP